MEGFYNNSGYRNNRNRKKILILDVDDSVLTDTHLGSGTDFSIDLHEPLIIDKHSEVYLDNFITYNSNISNIPENSAFVLKINEFNINSNVASSKNNNTIFNSIVIPNEHSTTANYHSVVLHKAKKFNYLCDINPCKITKISGKITNLAGDPMFHGTIPENTYTYALTGIDVGSLDKPIPSGSEFSDITNLRTGGAASPGQFLAASHGEPTGSTTLHFSSDTPPSNFTVPATTSNDNITFVIAGGTGNLVLTNTDATNMNLSLIQNPGRFIAEFSINSRE